ncbi:MAG: hypothetical protein IPL61_23730 [Myxococcales bacterium]|nr:hypothetical protein [Myxococcales bacterium]
MRTVAAVVAALAVACSDSALFGPPTEATCPPTSTTTWVSFGEAFMTRYCTRCHATDLVGADRHGAPSFHDFDTPFGVRVVRAHIDETSAAGPAAVNTSMPPDGERPTLAERQQLGEWLACGAP